MHFQPQRHVRCLCACVWVYACLLERVHICMWTSYSFPALTSCPTLSQMTWRKCLWNKRMHDQWITDTDNTVGSLTLYSEGRSHVELLNCVLSSSETTSNCWSDMSGLKEGNYHSRQLSPCAGIIHAWWEPICNISEVFILEDYSQRTRAKSANISAWAFPAPGKWQCDCSEAWWLLPHLLHPPSITLGSHSMQCKLSAAQGGKNALTISARRLHFSLWPQGRAGAFRRHWLVERSLHNHYNLWSTSPC